MPYIFYFGLFGKGLYGDLGSEDLASRLEVISSVSSGLMDVVLGKTHHITGLLRPPIL